MQPHLEMHEIFRLAMTGEHHEHLDSCSFCRNEFDDALELLQSEASSASVYQQADQQWSIGHRQYRLAAQDADLAVADTHVRRTWYLENGSVVLRVMEDPERGILYGHLIVAPERFSTIAIRFSGIEADFHPDQKGIFEIGPAAIEIERMEAVLIEA